jgi:hypothetical protein
MLANSANYGLTNVLFDELLGAGPQSIDAISYFVTWNNKPLTVSSNSAGNNFVFWDSKNPTAMVHFIMANVAQQLISPVAISKVVPVGSSNRLDVVNMPVGLDGLVEGATNQTSNWATIANFTGNATSQSIFVQAPVFNLTPYPQSPNTNAVSVDPTNTNSVSSGTNGISFISAAQFYQLHFPCNWVWP